MEKSVFLLEDNDDLRELISYFLQDEDLQVTSFPNVESFNAGIAKELPNIFILDIQLPDGNGVDVCNMMISNPDTAHIPVILMSAHMDGKDISSTCGAADFIAKPFDVSDFVKRVKTYLEN